MESKDLKVGQKLLLLHLNQRGVEKEVIEVTVTVIDDNYFKISTGRRDKCFYDTLNFVISEKILCDHLSEKEFKATFLVSDLQCCEFSETIVCFRNKGDLKTAVLHRSLANKISNFDFHSLKYVQLMEIYSILNL